MGNFGTWEISRMFLFLCSQTTVCPTKELQHSIDRKGCTTWKRALSLHDHLGLRVKSTRNWLMEKTSWDMEAIYCKKSYLDKTQLSKIQLTKSQVKWVIVSTWGSLWYCIFCNCWVMYPVSPRGACVHWFVTLKAIRWKAPPTLATFVPSLTCDQRRSLFSILWAPGCRECRGLVHSESFPGVRLLGGGLARIFCPWRVIVWMMKPAKPIVSCRYHRGHS